ncbi:HNH endonuclease [Comamonas aquatica]|uniref:HNH endonuclease n=1 Tax=Comamonas aquatica TaxID=225991 RepID=UPI0031D2145B
MKVMPLHRKGWGNCGLEPGNREELDRKPKAFIKKSLAFTEETRMEHQALLETLDYDPATGVFTWKIAPNSRAWPGKVAGRLWNNQYRRISINGREYQEHRLAWFYVYKSWPTGEIDHINRIKHDNRISNLRCTTRSGNQQNKGQSRSNTSGIPGVYWHKRDKRWIAAIRVNGQKKMLGSYKELSDAAEAYRAAKLKHHIPTIF